MRSVAVGAGAERYEVLIGRGLLPQAARFVRQKLAGRRCAVVSDENVAPLYAGTVLETFQQAGIDVTLLTIAPGEATKSFAEAGALCEQLTALELDRTSFLVSLGGGVVGDLTGFVASIYLRGIPYVSLPTTLLAQVDSCVGGKTGVNSHLGKNLIGTFHRPALVVADTSTLQTLPERVWREGLAEAIKHGIIRDASLFASIAEVRREDCAAFVERNIAIKAAIVAEDEREEKGFRALLNFGHTIGHAIEHAAGYGAFLHGEALSLGMVAAARISTRRARLSLGDCERIINTLRRCELPTELSPDFSREKILAALVRDKKWESGGIRFVVAHEIGNATVSSEVTMEDIRTAVAEL